MVRSLQSRSFVATLRSPHANHSGVDVLRRVFLFLLIAKHLGLSWDIVKYTSFE